MMLATILLAAISFGDTATVQVEPLKFDLAAFKTMEMKEVIVDEDGEKVRYKGIPLRELLADQLKGGNAMVNMRDLSDAVLLVRATDNYQTAISAAEVAMDKTGERFILALERDGKPLPKEQGHVMLVIPSEASRVRWVRMIVSVDLVRLPRPKTK